MKRLLVVCAFASVAALMLVASSSAAPTGGTLSISPAAPLLGDSLVFTGCGWNATNPSGTQNLMELDIRQPDFIFVTIEVPVAKSGCFTTVAMTYLVMQPGAYTVQAFQKYRQAFLSFIVVG